MSENIHGSNHMTTAANQHPFDNGHIREEFGSQNQELTRET